MFSSDTDQLDCRKAAYEEYKNNTKKRAEVEYDCWRVRGTLTDLEYSLSEIRELDLSDSQVREAGDRMMKIQNEYLDELRDWKSENGY